MMDANGRWNATTALQAGEYFADYEAYWFEELIWYDDLPGHAQLTHMLASPIGLGEQFYTRDAFRNYITAGAAHFDATRLAGITEWWHTAELALAHYLPVVPHIGDMMQVHLHLAAAHSACALVEYIPTLKLDALAKYNVLGSFIDDCRDLFILKRGEYA
jgi:L-alanine-DL-glutamate epimerase-like enolase superfamily enzyme